MKIMCNIILKMKYGKYVAAVLLFMAWMLPARAQTVQTGLSGVYYIANYYQYNASNHSKCWYMVPAKDPQVENTCADAYYSPNCNGGCNPEKPFITTYKTNRNDNDTSVWILKEVSAETGIYYMIHAMTGKYLVFEPPFPGDVSGNARRKSFHLQTQTDLILNDSAKFEITNVPNSVDDWNADQRLIRIKKIESGNRFLNPAGNQDNMYHANGGGTPNHYIGLVGVYNSYDGGTNNGNRNTRWYLESTLLTKPTINEVSQTTGKVTVTDVNGLPSGYNIRFTVSTDPAVIADPTQLENPIATSDIMPADGYLVEETCVIKAVVERYGVVLTAFATSGTLNPTIPNAPTVTTNCDNTFSLICDNMPLVDVYFNITTNGDEPEEPTVESTRYTEPVAYQVGYKIKAKAIQSGGNSSGITSHEFSVAEIHTLAPTITLEGTTVSISGPDGATIYYTTDGNDPTNLSSQYSAPFTISLSDEVDIRAIAESSGLLTSCVTKMLIPSAPSVEITTDDCSASAPRANVLTITGPDDGRTFWYAATQGQNSAAPTPGSSDAYIQYNGSVSLDDLDGSNAYYTVHAYAKSSDGDFYSSVVSLSHQMKTGGKPELTPPVGSNPVVLISGGVFGDVAVCSAGGVAPQNIPIESDGTAEYTIPAGASGTLTVVFKHGNWLTSCEATYTLPGAPATPTFSQDCADLLSLACETPMADIHYTTDNTEPTLQSQTYITGCLDNLTFGTIIRAKAFIGFRASDELTFPYTQLHSEKPQFFVEGEHVVISVPNHAGATIYYNYSTDGSEPAEVTITNYQVQGNTFELEGITIFSAIAVYDDLEPSCAVRVVTRIGYSINSADDLSNLSEHSDKYFFVYNDIDASNYTTTVETFTGVIEGNNHTISGLTKPLFGTATDAVIHDLNLADVDISAAGHVGAIAQTANGETRIYNCGILGENSAITTTSTSGNSYVGGLVGLLDGSARVINCFSYANINGGTHRAGIVGYNNFASTSGNLKTMVMNCMFYGDISTAGEPAPTIYPVYGGLNIHNKRVNNTNNTGLNNYCYFYYHGDYVNHIANDNYHGSLGAEERFLNRFEFFRLTLNSTRNMAAFYVSGDATETDLIAKWVLDKSIAPYPILKAPGYYPSVVNHDAEHAVPIDPDNEHYNEGRKLGTLTVIVQMGNGGPVFSAPTGASIPANTQLTLNITDKDFAHDAYSSGNYDFNYKKVQLPYYNQVGTGNYTNNRVVTGWKIVGINGNTTGTGSFTTENYDYPNWNFVDRNCSNKDLYSVSGRVFSQGAYWEVPDGVTSITIEPYWAKAAYLSDTGYDMTYINGTKYKVTVAGSCPTTFNEQTVYNAITDVVSNDVVVTPGAVDALEITADHSVYDYAVVLVGNYHQYATNSLYTTTENKPVTFMSADLDGDCEPDNTLFYYHQARKRVAPIRFDFLNMPGIGMVKRTWDNAVKPEPGIFKPAGWFEITNTVVVRFGQFEYCDGTSSSQEKLFTAPLILQGGIYEQFVSSKNAHAPDYTPYILIGGNAWFKNFANGCHTDGDTKTHNMPINVTGGDYEHFYLSGIYRPSCPSNGENAECYMDGGRFGEVAGAGMQEIGGSVTWCINAADIENFFGGGINAAKPITGAVTTTISNSRVTEFYGGPKFGDMKLNKNVTTTASNCHFGLFFGAGYGGTAYNRLGCEDVSSTTNTPPWNDTYVPTHYSRSYETNHTITNANGSTTIKPVNAISTSYEYEYILHSDGNQTVARFFVNFAELSLASTQDVVTELTGCTIGTFYGGGRLGAVNGSVESTLTDCTVEGNAYGSGFSAETPTVMVMDKEGFDVEPKYNRRAGVFNDAEVKFPASVQYLWKHTDVTITDGSTVFEEDGDKHYILTNVSTDNLGAVLGNATLTINGNSVVMGDVYGGGAKSSANTNGGTAKITVNIDGGTYGVNDGGTVTGGNIYGGGMGDLASLATLEDPDHSDIAVTEGIVELNIGNSTQSANNVVIHGSVFGCNNINGSPKDNVTVHVYKTKHNSSNIVSNLTGGYAIKEVFGGGNKAHYTPTVDGKMTTVHIHDCDNTIQYVYGGGNAANVGTSDGIKSASNIIIDGGRIEWVFGGGNGAGEGNPGANIYDDVNVAYHAGDIKYFFGGSNEKGLIGGSKNVSILNDLSCSIDNHIAEFYGGNNKAPITGGVGTTLTMPCTSDPCKIDYVFGGSREAHISGDVVLNIEGGDYDYVFGGNNISGVIDGNVTLNLYGGTIHHAAFGGNKGGGSITGNITVNVEDRCNCPLQVHDIFGAGDLAEYTAPGASSGRPDVREFNPIVNVNHICGTNTITGNVYGGGNGNPADETQVPGSVNGHPLVIIGDLTEEHEGYRAAINGNVYGGGNAAKVTGGTSVLMQKANSTVGGDIYGGGNLANVSGATSVNVTGGTVSHDVYGGGALANTGGSNVTLDGGTISGDLYGGGLGRVGDDPIAALVTGPVQVTVNGGTVTGSVYGCNNVNGAPQSTVNVDINGTDQPASGYALGHVFGGGNQAAYSGVPVVKVHNCNNSIEYVYGGGNAASVRGTDVTIYGGNTIGNVFGGCFGADVTTSGTDVKIYGGTILKVFGGNNESGEISGNIQVNVNKQTEEGHDPCPMKIDEVYGGGNVAPSAAGSITIGCTGDLVSLTSGQHYGIDQEGIRYVYGGANEAAITGNISLTIASGIVENVFGGNNKSGDISGSITVNIEKDNDAACAEHWYVGNVYGGGNQAKYQPTTPGAYPAVNIKNGTVSQNVFGGGLGATAKVYSNPQVTVGDLTEGHSGYEAIVSGNVYGGGSAAMVGDVGETPSINNTTVTIQKANSSVAKVFGAGMAAGVTGTTTVNVNNGTVSAGAYGGCDASGEVGGDITVSVTGGTVGTNDANREDGVFGGGYGGFDDLEHPGTSTKGNVTVTISGGDVYGDVYGGSAKGSVNDASGDQTAVTLNGGTIHGDLYGGGLGDTGHAAAVNGAVQVNVYGGAVNDVFGCNNVNGAPQSSVQVNINQTGSSMTVNDVYGGGNMAAYSGTPDVNIQNGTVSGKVYGGGNNITTANAGVAGSNVEMTGGTVLGGVYGGCNLNGYVTGNSEVKIYGGTIGSQSNLNNGTTANVFGGGLGVATRVSGNVTVTGDKTGTNETTIYGDVYGGSDQGQVNNGSGNTTTVHILDGTLVTNSTTFGVGGNVFGGGRGVDNNPSNAEKGKVNGKVVVNIGAGTPNETTPYTVNVTGLDGNATIGGNVYGCNNAGGSPQSDVTVNIFQTAHNEGETGYAIANVFGGGNEANFSPAEGKTYVNVYTCANTIRRVFGGGNAAATPEVNTHIQGGRFFQVFGGGNGERGEQFGANVNGDVHLYLHGGSISEYYGGSNQHGTISGTVYTEVLNDGPCESVSIEDFYCGGNFEDIFGDLVTTIACSDAHFTNLYGGCNQATIYGDVILNLRGGIYTNVFGGSRGVPGTSADILAVTPDVHTAHPELTEGHGGNVTLNLYGGTIVNVFGGSNINGNIEGKITVNVLDEESTSCPLIITNIYGGSNETDYTPNYPLGSATERITPVVNLVHAKNGISGNVYGGSKGVEGAIGDDVTKVVANPLVNIGYESGMTGLPATSDYNPTSYSRKTSIQGSVFGGGDAAKVEGNTEIRLNKGAKVIGNVYGGGNMGEVAGDTKVIVNGKRQ